VKIVESQHSLVSSYLLMPLSKSPSPYSSAFAVSILFVFFPLGRKSPIITPCLRLLHCISWNRINGSGDGSWVSLLYLCSEMPFFICLPLVGVLELAPKRVAQLRTHHCTLHTTAKGEVGKVGWLGEDPRQNMG